jgi:GrpB-like predicted nucleotidyltransferase (UPF0157 family)
MLETHNPQWHVEFTELCEVYQRALGPLVLRIEHVGSTAVPGLLAKPILDIDLVISGYEVFPRLVAGLAQLGYSHNGDQGIPEREAFNPKGDFTPLTVPPRKWMTHHLYVCPERSRELQRHVRFRDALLASPQLRLEYEKLKRDLAEKAADDRKIYARMKEEACREFIEAIVADKQRC